MFLFFAQGRMRLACAAALLVFIVALVSGQATLTGNERSMVEQPTNDRGILLNSGKHPNREADSLGASALAQVLTTSNVGRVLVDNHINASDVTQSSTFDEAQGFTTGPDYYRLSGVEITVDSITSDGAISLAINEPTGSGQPGTTLYELENPSELTGKAFFSAPEGALLEPNTSYLVRIDITSGSATVHFTSSYDESALGLPGWSIADQIWSSSGPGQGLAWETISTSVYAITVKGSVIPDSYGENTYNAGRLAFSRFIGQSPIVEGLINDGTDTDWFETSLSFDYGGRYRIDVEPLALTDDDDIGIRAFYVDYPSDHSRDPAVELTPVTDPPEGYVSWHFIAGHNYGPYIEVYADNDTTGAYAIRVVYDPDRIWTGTEIVRGDLPGDDTTWATITLDSSEADVGIYHYYEDHDWYAVDLEENTSYLFLAIAAGAYSSYIDPVIKLYDSAGNELASDYISQGDSSTTSVNVVHQVGTGEEGTYYVDVSNATLMDDADSMDALGITDPFEIYSPFIGTRYFVTASTANNRRSARSASRNTEPRIFNATAFALPENTAFLEHITADDSDGEDSITGYEISGGADEELFSLSSKGVLAMTISPDFEVPADANIDNVYEVQVRVFSGSGDRERSTTADVTVTVADDDTEAERVLVSNTGQRNNGSATVNNSDSAIRIRTGSNPEGYMIHSVALKFWEALEDPSGVRVALRSSQKPGKHIRPKDEIFAFTNPVKTEARLTEFTAPPDTVLEPDTSYWIMIEKTGDTALKFLETASNSEDSISAADWDIGTLRFHRTNSLNGPWGNHKVGSDQKQLKLRVIGYARTGE